MTLKFRPKTKIIIGKLIAWRRKHDREMSDKYGHKPRSFPVSGCFTHVPVKVSLTTNQRKFSCGTKGEAIAKVTIEVDLSKMRHPWQPHVGQADDFAEQVADMLMEDYHHFRMET